MALEIGDPSFIIDRFGVAARVHDWPMPLSGSTSASVRRSAIKAARVATLIRTGVVPEWLPQVRVC